VPWAAFVPVALLEVLKEGGADLGYHEIWSLETKD
jgi:hypothetical protein